MKKHLFVISYVVIILFATSSCLALSEEQKKEYGILESAVTFSSDKVIGEYGDRIPGDFNGKTFLLLVKDKIPEDYYEALTKHQLDVTPKGSYYLLLIFESRQLILFDYSCTPEVDGPVLLEPEKYDVNHLELYDQCKDNPK
jgi:hypothetical protein